jgi:hypothetical protein
MPVGFFPTNPVVAQSIGAFNQNAQVGLSNYNDNATREAIAREQARVQQAQLQQQQMLQQQQLAQRDFFGRSEADFRNRELAARERMMLGQGGLNAQENALDRATRIKVAEIGATASPANAVNDAKMALLESQIDTQNSDAQAAAARSNQILRAKLAMAKQTIEDAYTAATSGRFTFDSTKTEKAKLRDKALRDLENPDSAAYQALLVPILTDTQQHPAVMFDKGQFVARPLASRSASPGSAGRGQQFFNSVPNLQWPTPAPTNTATGFFPPPTGGVNTVPAQTQMPQFNIGEIRQMSDGVKRQYRGGDPFNESSWIPLSQ